MAESELIDIMRQFLWAGVWMGAPLIGAALVIGVCVGLFQALTSIQEMTLTFAPKLLGMMIVYWLCAGYMANILLKLFNTIVIPTIAGM